MLPGGIVGNGGGPHQVDHHNVFNELFHLHSGINSTVAAIVTSGDTQVEVASDVGFTVGDAIQINDGQIETTFPIITAKPGGNVLTLDRPLDFPYGIGDLVEVIHTDLKATAGTLTVPIIHRIAPEAGKVWHLHRIILAMTHSAAATDDKFGSIAALTNGVVLRAYIGGQFFSFTNWKTNGDIIADMYDVTYSDKAGASLFGTSARGSFNRIGVTIRLDGDVGDYMDVLVQDNLTTLGSFIINGQGYVENV